MIVYSSWLGFLRHGSWFRERAVGVLAFEGICEGHLASNTATTGGQVLAIPKNHVGDVLEHMGFAKVRRNLMKPLFFCGIFGSKPLDRTQDLSFCSRLGVLLDREESGMICFDRLLHFIFNADTERLTGPPRFLAYSLEEECFNQLEWQLSKDFGKMLYSKHNRNTTESFARRVQPEVEEDQEVHREGNSPEETPRTPRLSRCHLLYHQAVFAAKCLGMMRWCQNSWVVEVAKLRTCGFFLLNLGTLKIRKGAQLEKEIKELNFQQEMQLVSGSGFTGLKFLFSNRSLNIWVEWRHWEHWDEKLVDGMSFVVGILGFEQSQRIAWFQFARFCVIGFRPGYQYCMAISAIEHVCFSSFQNSPSCCRSWYFRCQISNKNAKAPRQECTFQPQLIAKSRARSWTPRPHVRNFEAAVSRMKAAHRQQQRRLKEQNRIPAGCWVAVWGDFLDLSLLMVIPNPKYPKNAPNRNWVLITLRSCCSSNIGRLSSVQARSTRSCAVWGRSPFPVPSAGAASPSRWSTWTSRPGMSWCHEDGSDIFDHGKCSSGRFVFETKNNS